MYLKLLTSDNAHIYASMIPDAFLNRDEFLGVVCLNETDAPLGIAVVEPRVAETLNNAFSEDEKYTDTARLKQAKLKDRKVGANFSYNTFVTSMFCQSAILANYRMGKKISSNINIADSETKSLVKKIFREMCFLNGINPENLSIPSR